MDRGHAIARHRVAEEHHIGFDDAGAAAAVRHREAVQIVGLEMRVAVGRRHGGQAGDGGVRRFEFALDFGARMPFAASQADHRGEAAVQLDHAGAAGGLMQAVDILRDQCLDMPGLLQPGERAMRVVGQGARHDRPAHHAARPIALPARVRFEKLAVLDRRARTPVAIGVAVAGDARVGADAGAGQHQQPRVAAHEVDQRLGIAMWRTVGCERGGNRGGNRGGSARHLGGHDEDACSGCRTSQSFSACR